MSNELEQLARRAVACKGWRWIPGMLANCDDYGVTSLRIVKVWENEFGNFADAAVESVYGQGPNIVHPEPGMLTLDLCDPLTAAGLLLLVREAYNAPEACTGKIGPFWYVYPMADNGIAATTPPLGMTWNDRHTTELAALVAALEAAR